VSDSRIELWIVAAVWLLAIWQTVRATTNSSHGSVGLPIAFVFSTTFLYIGAASYLVPGYTHLRGDGSLYLASYHFTEETVYQGSLATAIGMLGFMIGCRLLSPVRARNSGERHHDLRLRVDPRRRRRIMLVLGGFALFGFLAVFVRLNFPLVQALSQVSRNVAVVVVCLGAALAMHVDGGRYYFRWIVLAALIPAIYLIYGGFTSYGFITLTILVGFWLTVLARKKLGAIGLAVGGFAVTYGLLVLFVVWMSFREELRAVLWSGSAGLVQRLEAIGRALSNIELLRPSNFAALDIMNTRLNQYVFVGKAIEWHEMFPEMRTYGETLYVAFLAWVPRFVWEGKPRMGGSTFVAEHTGMIFSSQATFGAGPVFEFYVSFGHVGVFLGLLVLGLVVRWVDRMAAVALRQGRLFDHVRWFTVGLAFIAPLTDFFFMINTALASYIVLTAMKLVVEGKSRQGHFLAPGSQGRSLDVPVRH
jgi:hypothetical protein